MSDYKLPEVLRALLKEKKISQEKFAEAINSCTRTVGNWITGRTYPNINDVLIIADFFGVTINKLVFGDEKGGRWSD